MDKTKEIDVIYLTKKVLKEKLLMVKFVAVFAVIGIIYAINKPKEWTSVVVLAPEATSMGMTQSLGEIAGMIGLGSGGSNSVDAIYPDIYPDIFNSTDFVTKLFNLPVRTKANNKYISYYDHLDKDIPTPFWSYPKTWITKALSIDAPTEKVELFHGEMTKKDASICDIIRTNISCQLDKGTNLITITATDIDPYVATIVVDTLQKRLQGYITEYRTKKANVDLAYAIKMNNKAKHEYELARQRYANSSDGHFNVVLKSVSSKIQDLENEMNLKSNFYNQTVSQVENATMKVQESTPAFTVIQSAIVPIKASSTPRSIMVLIFMLLGVLADAVWVLYIRGNVTFFKKKN